MALGARCLSICKQLLKLNLNHNVVPVRNREFYLQKPKKRYGEWLVRRSRVIHDDYLTSDNRQFVNRVVEEQTREVAELNRKVTFESGPLRDTIPEYGVWTPHSKRTGLIAKKIGEYPMWSKQGEKINTTLLQVVDNSVIKYIPPEEWNSRIQPHKIIRKRLGCLLVGAETIDPSLLTKEFYGIFKNAGVAPKKHIFRFPITPEAALPPGAPLTVSHYSVGDVVDIRGLTIDYGFQGVMKRWGFKGMPASHGVTKTHRRPGNIGGGGEKGRVWPGTKLPGHMGNRWRILRGVTILRIDHEHGVLWVRGCGVPGVVGGTCYVYDTVLPLRRRQTSPPFPTRVDADGPQEEALLDEVHPFGAPTIVYPE